MIGHVAKKLFHWLQVRAGDSPHDLILSGRSVEHEIRSRNIERAADKFDGLLAVTVDIEVDVANFPEAVLCPAVRALLDRVHADENVGPAAVLFAKRSLKFGARRRPRLL